MDNLTHTLVGWWLAKTRLGRRSPLSAPALIVAANVPDIDVVVRPFGGTAAYLDHHRGFTHGVLGVLLLIAALTAVVRALERARGAPPGRGPALAVAIGVLSHPLLDLLNVYGLRPWLPFADTRYFGDLVFVVDPWLWLWLGVGVALTGRRSRRESLALLVAALATIGIVYGVGRTRLPDALLIAWAPALLGLAWARWRGIGARRPRLALVASALLVCAHGLTLGVWREVSEQRALPALHAALAPAGRIGALARLPELARPMAWTVLADSGECLLWQPVDRGRLGPLRQADKHTADPAVLRAAETPAGRVWRRFARFPLAEVREADGGTQVRLTDGRYLYTDFCTLSVWLPRQ